jgi:hypothetical protein
MNYIPFIAIPIGLSICILIAIVNLRVFNGEEDSIYQTMKKNNNRVVRIRGISSLSEESPFSVFTTGSARTYKVDYINEANERKTIFVRFKGFSKEGTWKEAPKN